MELNSLMNPSESQQSLPLAGASFLDETVLDMVDICLESRGDHTAARLFLKNPQVYKAIMFMYASGTGQLKIADVLKVSVHTVIAVIRRENLTRGAAIDTAKTLQSMSDLREMTIETLMEKLADPKERAKIPFDKLMIGLGIQTEKIELLRGNATERIEHRDVTPAADEFERWLKDGSIDAESHKTGLSGGECGTKGELVTAGLLAPVPDALGDHDHASAAGTRLDVDAPKSQQNIDDVGFEHINSNVCNGFKDNDVSFDVSSQSRNDDHTNGNGSGTQMDPAPEIEPAPAQTYRGGGGQVLQPSQKGAMNE